jgi:hypothetical protein
MYRIFLLFVPFVLTFFVGCKDENLKAPDVSGIPMDVKIYRYEQELMKIDTNNIKKGTAELFAKYPKFSKIWFGPIMSDGTHDFKDELKMFLGDKDVRRLNDTIQKEYGNFEPYRTEINQGFRYFRYYFPKRSIPDVYTFFSMYHYGITPPTDTTMGIGLDFFLGENYFAYGQVENLSYAYIRRTLTKEYLTKTFFERLSGELVGESIGTRLIDQMMNNGKILYVLDCLLPKTPDSIKLGYTSAQTKWVFENESQVWAYFQQENLLYTTELQKINKLINASPNASGMPQEAPGRTANFIGWQIVKQYMERHPKISLEDILKMHDAQKILDDSKYKPKL